MIGEIIYKIRKQKGMTLTELGNSTGNSASYLSQVERGLIEPSISSLRKIAKKLNKPVYFFLLDESEDSFIIRKEERKIAETPWTQTKLAFITPVLREDKNLSMVGLEVNMLPYAETAFIEKSVHNAEEIIIILSGTLEVTIENTSYLLNEGDSIYLKANILHSLKNTGKTNMKCISCISPAIY